MSDRYIGSVGYVVVAVMAYPDDFPLRLVFVIAACVMWNLACCLFASDADDGDDDADDDGEEDKEEEEPPKVIQPPLQPLPAARVTGAAS